MSDYIVAKQHRVNAAVLNKVYLRALYDPTSLSSQVRIVLGEGRKLVERVVDEVMAERGYIVEKEEEKRLQLLQGDRSFNTLD